MDFLQLRNLGWEDVSTPILNLWQGGKPLLPAQRQAVMDASVTQVLNKPGSFTLQVNNPDLGLIQGANAPFGLGARLAIGMGYAQQRENSQTLITAEVSAVGVDLDESGGFTCRVEGFDLLHKATQGTYENSLFDTPIVEMARAVAREMAAGSVQQLTFFTDDAPWQHQVSNQVQANESHFAFLEKLAEKYGYQFWVEAEKLFFKERREGTSVDLVRGQNLLSFSTRLSTASLVGAVEVRYAGNQTVTVRLDTLFKEIFERLPDVIEQQLKGGNGGKPITTVLQLGNTVKSPEEAKRLAEVALENISRNLLEVEGSCIGDPAIQPGTILKVKGMLGFDGEYVVESATHTLNQSGYRTSFAMKPDFRHPPVRKSGV